MNDTAVVPAEAGTQYAPRVLWLLDCPLSRAMTAVRLASPLRIIALAILLLLSSSLVVPAAARPIHIVAFGDSMTYGWLLPRTQAYPAQLQAALRKKGYDVAVKNAGVPGDTARRALQRFDQAIDPGTDICILEFGLNDRAQRASLATVRARIADLIRALQTRHIAVLVLGLGGLRFADLAAAQGALSLDFTLPPHKFRARDGAHYNARGNAMLVARLLPPLERLIARIDARYPAHRSIGDESDKPGPAKTR